MGYLPFEFELSRNRTPLPFDEGVTIDLGDIIHQNHKLLLLWRLCIMMRSASRESGL